MPIPALHIDNAGPEAPWLVLVHGMSQDHRVFDAQVTAFRRTHRVLLVDLPDHGLAADVGGPYGHVEMGGHVADALTDAGAAAVRFWGTHTGATLGL